MQYRLDKRSGNMISALGFGCMRFPRSQEETEALVMRAIEAGVNYFDTAYIYGNSEMVLGNILSSRGVRDRVYIATKLPLMMCRRADSFEDYFKTQLKRLQTDRIDYYLLHMLTDMALFERLQEWGIEDWIRQKKESGEIRQIGFSFHGAPHEFMRLIDAYDWDFCQIQYNYSDENYQAGVRGLKRAAEKGIPVIIMEPLLGGKLATNLPGEAVEAFRQVREDSSPAAWALRWLLDQEEVTCILSGMKTLPILEENIGVAEQMHPGMLTDAEREAFERVREVFRKTTNIPCTGCGYCEPCPFGVNIPACFSAYNASFSMGKRTGFHQYYMSTGALSVKQSRASQCTECGKCEKHCPQGIPIREGLKEVAKRFEPWWYRVAVRVVRGVLRKGK